VPNVPPTLPNESRLSGGHLNPPSAQHLNYPSSSRQASRQPA
jgi:hypothetical protein